MENHWREITVKHRKFKNFPESKKDVMHQVKNNIVKFE